MASVRFSGMAKESSYRSDEIVPARSRTKVSGTPGASAGSIAAKHAFAEVMAKKRTFETFTYLLPAYPITQGSRAVLLEAGACYGLLFHP
jgi:hypothetical protein